MNFDDDSFGVRWVRWLRFAVLEAAGAIILDGRAVLGEIDNRRLVEVAPIALGIDVVPFDLLPLLLAVGAL